MSKFNCLPLKQEDKPYTIPGGEKETDNTDRMKDRGKEGERGENVDV